MQTSVCISLLLLMASWSANSHECVHDILARRSLPERLAKKHALASKVSTQSKPEVDTEWKPIRIDWRMLETDPAVCAKTGDYISYGTVDCASNAATKLCDKALARTTNCCYACTAADVPTEKMKAYFDKLLPSVNSWLTETIMVKRFKEALSFAYAKADITADVQCGVDNHPFMLPSSLSIPNSDLLIIYTYRPTTLIAERVVAFGTDCVDAHEHTAGRPFIGHLNFSPNVDRWRNASNAELTANDLEYFENIIRHEVLHIIGFSSNLFSEWAVSPLVDNSDGTKSLKGTEMVKAAKEHFGCNTLTGVRLENWVTDGSSNSHWERTWFNNELMTAVTSLHPVVSKVSLAALEDSGWYKINYDKGVPKQFGWGKGSGCGFLGATACTTDPSWDMQKCMAGTVGCTYDRKLKAVCDNADASMKDCSYYKPTPNADCRVASQATSTEKQHGETYHETSRCFISTAFNATMNGTESIQHPACHVVSCVNSTHYKINVGGVWFDCNGNDVDFGNKQKFGSDTKMLGKIKCPPVTEVCVDYEYDPVWPQIVSVSPEVTTTVTVFPLTVTGKYIKCQTCVTASTCKCRVRLGGSWLDTVQLDSSITGNDGSGLTGKNVTLVGMADGAPLKALCDPTKRFDVLLVDELGKTHMWPSFFRWNNTCDATPVDNSAPAAASEADEAEEDSGNNKSKLMLIILIVGISAGAAIILLIGILLYRWRQRKMMIKYLENAANNDKPTKTDNGSPAKKNANAQQGGSPVAKKKGNQVTQIPVQKYNVKASNNV